MSTDDLHLHVKQFVINFLISGTAAAISKTVIAPIERSKLILQNQSSALQVIRGEIKPFKGFRDVFRRVPREQGLFSFWRGNGINILRYFPTQALNFAFYDTYKLVFQTRKDHTYWNYLQKLASGCAAGGTSALIVYPLELCQTRLTVDFGSDVSMKKKYSQREFSGLCNCVETIYKSGGIRGLYGGAQIAIFGISLYRGMYFSLFDTFKSLWWNIPLDNLNKIEQSNVFVNILLAQAATSVAGFLIYPLDTIGRGLMLDSGRMQRHRRYHTTSEAIKRIYQREGIVGFYKGCLINFFRGSAGAIVLVMYDEILYMTNWKERLINMK